MERPGIHDALAQVKLLQEVVLERRKFKGYSGPARMAGGFVALFGAIGISSLSTDTGPGVHLIGWGMVMLLALLFNYAGLALWFVQNREHERNIACLMPALDAAPALGLGAVLSLAMILHGEYSLLFGVWMGLYGLVHMSYRTTLPFANYWVGIYYLVSGAFFLLWPGAEFTQPWPMGIVFFVGETAGGLTFFLQQNPTAFKKEQL